MNADDQTTATRRQGEGGLKCLEKADGLQARADGKGLRADLSLAELFELDF